MYYACINTCDIRFSFFTSFIIIQTQSFIFKQVSRVISFCVKFSAFNFIASLKSFINSVLRTCVTSLWIVYLKGEINSRNWYKYYFNLLSKLRFVNIPCCPWLLEIRKWKRDSCFLFLICNIIRKCVLLI